MPLSDLNREIISVVVPVFNAADTLERCLESVLRQLTDRTEVVIVNDGSIDESLECVHQVLARWGLELSSQVKILSQENSGKFKAVEAALAVTDADWILILDADDYLVESALAQLFLIVGDLPKIASISQTRRIVAVDFPQVSNAQVESRFSNDAVISVSNQFKSYYGYNILVKGDRRRLTSAEVLRLSFKSTCQERHIASGLAWNRLSLFGDVLFLSQVLYVAELRSTGLTALGRKKQIKYHRSRRLYLAELRLLARFAFPDWFSRYHTVRLWVQMFLANITWVGASAVEKLRGRHLWIRARDLE